MSKDYYRKKIIDIRADIAKEREAKKKDNAYYAERIKSASPSNKPSYRKSKIDRAASHDRTIERLKNNLESAKESLKRAR